MNNNHHQFIPHLKEGDSLMDLLDVLSELFLAIVMIFIIVIILISPLFDSSKIVIGGIYSKEVHQNPFVERTNYTVLNVSNNWVLFEELPSENKKTLKVFNFNLIMHLQK